MRIKKEVNCQIAIQTYNINYRKLKLFRSLFIKYKEEHFIMKFYFHSPASAYICRMCIFVYEMRTSLYICSTANELCAHTIHLSAYHYSVGINIILRLLPAVISHEWRSGGEITFRKFSLVSVKKKQQHCNAKMSYILYMYEVSMSHEAFFSLLYLTWNIRNINCNVNVHRIHSFIHSCMLS